MTQSYASVRENKSFLEPPYLTPRGLLKGKTSTTEPCTVDDLKEDIRRETAASRSCICPFGASRPVVLGHWGRPL